jgi:hypothetical protein
MSAPSFPEYALKYADEARKTRLAMTLQLRQVADDIEAELARDPEKYPERIIPASTDGKSKIYQHPGPELQITFEVDRETKIIYLFHYFAPKLAPQPTVFVSYSHKDQEWLDKLRTFLTALEQRGVIRFWDDSQLVPGNPWERQITDVLNGSSAGLLLVSQNFLISQFVKDVELPKLLNAAKDRGKQIFWLHLSPSTVFLTHKEITEFQSLLPNPQTSLAELDAVNQQAAFVDITGKLMKYAAG